MESANACGYEILGHCNYCRKTCELRCQRCMDFYCSPLCQKRDWQFHRLNCFPMPLLVLPNFLDGLNTQLSQPAPLNNLKETAANTSISMESVSSSVSIEFPSKSEEKLKNYKNSLLQSLPFTGNAETSDSNTNGHLNLPDIDCPDGSIVILCSFRSMNRVYVRTSHPTVNALYEQQMDKIDRLGTKASAIRGHIAKNSIVFAELREHFHRIKILEELTKDIYRVQLVDTGMITCLDSKTFREANDYVKSLPVLIKQFQLEGTPNNKLPVSVYKSLSRFETNRYRIKYSKLTHSHLPLVSLIDVDNSMLSLNERLKEMKLNSTKSSSSEAIVSIEELENAPKEIGNKSNDKTNGILTNDSTNIAMNGLTPAKINHSLTPPATPFEISGSLKAKTGKESPKNEHFLPSISSEDNKESNLLSNSLIPHLSTNGNNNNKMKSSDSILQNRNSGERCMIPPFEFKRLTVKDKNVEMVVLDNSNIRIGYIGCILRSNIDKLVQIQLYLTKKFTNANGKPYTPIVKEYCIAKFDGGWYRAQVIGNPAPERFTVYYIDFTNEKTVDIDEIRAYPMDLTGDCCSSCCLIDGLAEMNLSNQIVNFLKDKLSYQSKFVINEVINIIEDCALVKCSTILADVNDLSDMIKNRLPLR